MKKMFMPRLLTLVLSFLLIGTFNASLNVYGQDSFKISDAYTFTLGITYEISSDQSSGNKMTMWYSENGYSGMQPQGNETIFMVFDLKSMKMVTLMEAQKMAMIIDLKKAGQQIPEQTGAGDEQSSNVKLTKTGKTETIAGYACDEYKIISDNAETYAWITSALGAGYGDYAKNLMMLVNGGKGNPASTGIPDMKGLTNGVLLKMELTDLSKNKKVTMIATEVNKDGKTVSTDGFKTMNMPGQ